MLTKNDVLLGPELCPSWSSSYSVSGSFGPWLGAVEAGPSLGLPVAKGTKARMATAPDHRLLLCGAVYGGVTAHATGSFGRTRSLILVIFEKGQAARFFFGPP